jgi:hypothetical protein
VGAVCREGARTIVAPAGGTAAATRRGCGDLGVLCGLRGRGRGGAGAGAAAWVGARRAGRRGFASGGGSGRWRTGALGRSEVVCAASACWSIGSEGCVRACVALL